nr:hypothetical protein [Tanacetum cinerariifolium]
MIPLYGDDDLTITIFIQAEVECSSSPIFTSSDNCCNNPYFQLLPFRCYHILGVLQERQEKNKRYKSSGSSSFNTALLVNGSLNLDMATSSTSSASRNEEALAKLMVNEYACLNNPHNIKKTHNREAFIGDKKEGAGTKGTKAENARIWTMFKRQNVFYVTC